MDPIAQTLGQQAPAVEVILGHAVLDRHDREAFAQVDQIGGHAFGIDGLALAGHDVFAVLEELGRGDVEAQVEILAREVARRLARLGDEAQRLIGRGQIRRKAALVADVGVVPGVLQLLLQGVEDFGAHAHGVRKRLGARGQDHELLDVDRIVCVGAAVDDVHHRGRQDAGRDAAQIAIKFLIGRQGAGLGDRQRHAQDRIGAQTALVGRAVQFDHRLVDPALLLGVHAGQGVEDLAVDGVDRLLDALAAPHVLVAVT